MIMQQVEDFFLNASREWGCDGYHADVRYIVRVADGSDFLWHASVALAPLPYPSDNSMELRTSGFLIGQQIRELKDKADFYSVLEADSSGRVALEG